MKFDWRKWAIVAPNNDSGLGRMSQDMKAVLPIGRHLVASADLLENRSSTSSSEVHFFEDSSSSDITDSIEGLQGLIFFERITGWHPELLRLSRKIGLRIVCVPMWEWFRGVSTAWKNCDFFVCPNRTCERVVGGYGFRNVKQTTWTLDIARLPHRIIQGSAIHFVHNCGRLDPDDRKGTFDTIQAFEKARNANIRLTVRTQLEDSLSSEDKRISISCKNLPEVKELYAEGDVFIQPSKLEGIGFMVLEAIASGLPVITQDIAPLNEYGNQSELHVLPRRFKWPAYSSAWIEHSHLRLPHSKRLVEMIEWCSKNEMNSISLRNRIWAERTFDREILLKSWEAILAGVLTLPKKPFIPPSTDPQLPCNKLSGRARHALMKFAKLQLPMRTFL